MTTGRGSGQVRGERVNTAVLVAADIPNIRALAANGYSRSQVAKLFGVSKQCINKIVWRQSWAHID